MTVTLEHRASRSADRLVLKGETREGGHRERSAKEKTAERKGPQRKDNAGPRAGRRTPRYSREKVKIAEWRQKWPENCPLSAKTGRIWGRKGDEEANPQMRIIVEKEGTAKVINQ